MNHPAETLEGGCLCGTVRYRATAAPYDAANCHCSRCRKAIGAAYVSWVSFDRRGFEFVAGAPHRYRASEKTVRTFCGGCGTSLTFEHDDKPREVVVTIASLDDPESIPPERHEWTDRRLSWVRLADDLPCFAARPPDADD